MAALLVLPNQMPEPASEGKRNKHQSQQVAGSHAHVHPEKARRLLLKEIPSGANLRGVADQAMKERKPQARDQVEDPHCEEQYKQQHRGHCRNLYRREVEWRMHHRHMTRRLAAVRRIRVEIAAESLGDDRNQAKLKIGSPGKGPEKKIPGALNRG